MSGSVGRVGCALAVAAALAFSAGLRAQTQFARGQDVAPIFEGWEPNPDGGFNMVFGYLNRNYEEEVDIPVGPNNTIDVGGQAGDRGQPTHFYPRRQSFVFQVAVPKDFDRNRRVVWTLIFRGKTSQAKGWLQPEWELNADVIVQNNDGGVPDPNNKAPSITGVSDLTVTLPAFATLNVTATDDGLPMARDGRVQGVKISWSVYRGAGPASVFPDVSRLEYGRPISLTSTASFRVPGTYVLRATATDGQLSTHRNVTVTVK